MDVFRTVLLVIHLVTLAGLLLALAGLAPRRLGRVVVVGAGLMALSGVALVGVRSALDLDVNTPKVAVKELVLVGIFFLARRLAPQGNVVDYRPSRGVTGGIASLLLVDVVVAVAWT